jgi:hypothetical protein
MDRPLESEGAILENSKRVFTEGMTGPSGYPPTRLTARFMNLLTDELIHLVEAAGIEPSDDDPEQVKKAIAALTNKSSPDLIVGNGFGEIRSLKEALEGAESGSRILVKSNQTLSETIYISKPDIELNFWPGVTVTGKTAELNTSLFDINAPRITFVGGRFGFDSIPAQGQHAFYGGLNGKYLLLNGVRLFGFEANQPGFTGQNPIFPNGLIRES